MTKIMTTIYWLICTNCDWQGEADELVSLTDNANDKDFSYCPYCSGEAFDEEEEEVEEE